MQSNIKQDSWLKVFYRAQFSAFAGGVCDYGLMILLTELFGMFYPYAIVCGGTFGALINFSVNRYWAFKRTDIARLKQLKRFIFVVLGSIALKSFGTYVLAEGLQIDYKICRVIVDLVISLGFNFTLQKYWVFREE